MRSQQSNTKNFSIFCPIAGHEDHEIIYFCCNKDCFVPLCQECIQIHNEYHDHINKDTVFQKFKDIKDTLSAKVKNATTEFETEREKLQELLVQNAKENDSDLRVLSNYRTQLISLINDLFDNFELEYKGFAREEKAKKAEIVKEISGEINLVLNQLNKHKADLDSLQCLQVIQKIYPIDFDSELTKILNKSDFHKLEIKSPRINIHSDIIANVKQQITDLINIKASLHTEVINSSNNEQSNSTAKASFYYSPNETLRQNFKYSGVLDQTDIQEKSQEEAKTYIQSESVIRKQSTEGLARTSGFLSKSEVPSNDYSVESKDQGVQSHNKKISLGENKEIWEEGVQKISAQLIEEEKQDFVSQEEDEKLNDGDEVLSQQTVESSEYMGAEMKGNEDEDFNNHSEKLSGVSSSKSEQIIFEEIVASPRAETNEN